VLTNDLPVPVDATDIAFDPARPYLACATAMPLTDAREYFTRELAAMGFALWPGLAQQEANKKAAAEPQKAAHAYYVRDNSQPLHLVLRRGDDNRTKIEIEAVSAEMLTAELAPDPTPAAPETRYRAKKAADPMDAMIENAMQQMTEAVLMAAGEAVASAGKPTAKPHTSSMEEAPETTAAAQASEPAASAEPGLVAENMDGFPIPESHTSAHSGKTKFRTERDTTVPASLGSVLAFYRRELPKSGWKEADAVVAADRAVLSLVSDKGRGVLTLSRQDGETAVSFVERREAEAKKAGILPKAGQAKLIFGSMAEAPAKVIFGKRTITIPPGMGGSERPDGPMLDLPPGKYAYSVVVGGAAPTKEEVEVADGESWALVIGPGGGSMPLHMY
jgi:hypothetical protein